MEPARTNPKSTPHLDEHLASSGSRLEQRIRRSPVWSATPTPLNANRRLDCESVIRMVIRHSELKTCGLFLGGTCGEGPWLHPDDLKELVSLTASAVGNDLVIAAQVSDNSALRILRNIDEVAERGADLAVMASPYAWMNHSDARLFDLYRETIERSCLPVVFYDRGRHTAFPASEAVLSEIYAMEKVALVKDSSGDVGRRKIALHAREKRPGLLLANGDEFRALEYFQAGYDAGMFGGSILIARHAMEIHKACQEGRENDALEIERAMQHILHAVYGGPQIECWLTGLKESLVALGVFATNRSFLDYPLTEGCRTAIAEVIQSERAWLCPHNPNPDLSSHEKSIP
jgi:4-hydroxy-tetrahydrodipicolinate synthase